jgi:hypothetical protein
MLNLINFLMKQVPEITQNLFFMLNSYGQVWLLTLGIEHNFRFTEFRTSVKAGKFYY